MFENYPDILLSQKTYIMTSTLATLECVMKTSIDAVCRQIASETTDVDAFPHVKERFENLGLMPENI